MLGYVVDDLGREIESGKSWEIKFNIDMRNHQNDDHVWLIVSKYSFIQIVLVGPIIYRIFHYGEHLAYLIYKNIL